MFHFITHLATHTSRDPFVHAITNWIILEFYTRFQNLNGVLITLSCWIGSLTHNGVTVSPLLLSLLTTSALLPQQAPACQTSPTLRTICIKKRTRTMDIVLFFIHYMLAYHGGQSPCFFTPHYPIGLQHTQQASWLKSWSCHLICIMATNLLHWTWFIDSNIKNHLCWHSNIFLMYLCKSFYTALQHTTAITFGLGPHPGLTLAHQKPMDAPCPTNWPDTKLRALFQDPFARYITPYSHSTQVNLFLKIVYLSRLSLHNHPMAFACPATSIRATPMALLSRAD